MVRYWLILSVFFLAIAPANAQIKWNNPGSGNNKVPQVTPEDENLEFVRRDIHFNKRKLHRASVAAPDGAMTVKGFEGHEKSIIHRFQSMIGECADNNWDCRAENRESYTTRSEVSLPGRDKLNAKIGDKTTVSYDFYLAENDEVAHHAVYDDFFHFGQFHGYGDEDVPINVGIGTSRNFDLLDQTGKRTNKKLHKGDLAVFLRAIVLDDILDTQYYRAAVLLEKRGEYYNKWHSIKFAIKWAQDKTGSLKITWNNDVVFSCIKCVTAPVHELAGIADGVKKPMRFYFKYGIYNWRMGDRSKKLYKDRTPPVAVVYYKNVKWEN